MGQKVALVLSGGGARGIAHIGVIEELEKRGYEITSVAGTSMGALVGGVYAAGELTIFKEWISTLDKFMVLSLMDFSLSKNGLVKGERILKELGNLIPDIDIQECRIPYAAVATDLKTRKEVVFDSGRLLDGIRASISLPPLFKPFFLNNMVLIDGGTTNHLPLNRVKRCEGDILVAVDVSANIPVIEEYPKVIESNLEEHELSLLNQIRQFKIIKSVKKEGDYSYIDLLKESVTIMFQKIAEQSVEMYKPDMLIQMPIDSYNVLEFYEAEMIIKAGAKAAREVLDKQ